MENTITKYQSKSIRLTETVLADIRKGRFEPEQPLPAEENLADIYGVSRSTIRRVISLLTDSGELQKEPHRGVWIRNRRSSHPAESRIAGEMKRSPCLPLIDEVRKSSFSVCAMIQTDTHLGSPRSANEFVSGYLSGMSEEANNLNISLIVHYVPLKDRERADDPAVLPAVLRNDTECGVVLIHSYPLEVVRRLSSNYPIVSLQYDYRLPQVDFINAGMNHAIESLVESLYRHGHRQIAFAGEIKNHWWTISRFSGYVETITELGLRLKPENIFDFSEQSFDELILRLRQRIADGVTALVCEYDFLGYKIMQRLQDLGIRIPEELSLTGFDAVPVPPGLLRLNSVRYPAEYIGAAAVRALVERKQKTDLPARQILFDCSLVDGESVDDINN